VWIFWSSCFWFSYELCLAPGRLALACVVDNMVRWVLCVLWVLVFWEGRMSYVEVRWGGVLVYGGCFYWGWGLGGLRCLIVCAYF